MNGACPVSGGPACSRIVAPVAAFASSQMPKTRNTQSLAALCPFFYNIIYFPGSFYPLTIKTANRFIMDSVSGPSADHLNAPYAQRWELLKDVMTRLYMDERKKYKEIVKIMESEYQFYAS